MNIKKSNLLKIPLAPIFFAVSSILVLFFHNISELSLQMLIVPLLGTILFSITVTFLFSFIFKSSVKTNLFSSIFMVMFFSFRDIVSILGNKTLLAAGFILILILLFFIIKKTSRKLLQITKFLFLVSGLALIIPVLQITYFELTQRSLPPAISQLKIESVQDLNKDDFPDIYYIILDSYSAPRILNNSFGFNDSGFVNFLEEKGFYVATDSASNYPKTFLSVTSTLNMEYLDYLSNHKNSSDQTVVGPLIENNNVLRFLKNLGYRYYQMGSWWGLTKFNKLADKNYILEKENKLGINQFSFLALQSTIANPIITRLFPQKVLGYTPADKLKRIIYQFETFPEVIKNPGPKFVFSHIIAPHGPYVLGKNCEFVTKNQTKDKSDEENYINQLNCINTKIKVVINSILENSGKPPVIILQSDEGAGFYNERLKPWDNWKTASDTTLKNKFPILAAFYLPNLKKTNLYSSISPVNSFRVILNDYFSTNLPLLEDKHYIFLDLNHLYQFIDITNRLK